MVLLFGTILMAVIAQATVQATTARQCSYARDISSEERFGGCRGLAEGAYILNDSDGCDDDFYHCKNSRLIKYTCSFGCVFNEETNSCVDRFTVSACRYDD